MAIKVESEDGSSDKQIFSAPLLALVTVSSCCVETRVASKC